MHITAKQKTVLKKRIADSSELGPDEIILVEKGKEYPYVSFDEMENEDDTSFTNGHAQVELAYSAGTWYVWEEHWLCPWHKESKNGPETEFAYPEWDEVDWNGPWDTPVSKYFTLGEVCNMSRERIPIDAQVKQNIIAIARQMDEIREWWGGALFVTSWNRPWTVNRRIGSRAPNHPEGHGIDFRPMNGSAWGLQRRFEDEWYRSGKWNGGFGRGANKGFVHLDLRGRRAWNY